MDKLNLKRFIILCFPIVFALSLAITLAACMAQAGRTLDESALGDRENENEATTAGAVSGTSPEASIYSSGLTYKAGADGGAILTGIGSCRDEHIRIPEKTPDGVRITAIGDSAFIGVENLKALTLPTSVKEIGAYAFYGSSLESITLTSGIQRIGECCFANCKSLKSINVDSANTEYCSLDGVLFSKDKTNLICYPSGKTDSEYTMRLGVKNISSAAFYGCTHLVTVRFNGNESEWAQIKIGANNDSLLGATLVFKKNDVK